MDPDGSSKIDMEEFILAVRVKEKEESLTDWRFNKQTSDFDNFLFKNKYLYIFEYFYYRTSVPPHLCHLCKPFYVSAARS